MTKSRCIALCVALGIVGFVAACMDTLVEPEPTISVSQEASAGPQASIDLLARGLAMALAHDDFRTQILEDMRDSPFPNHSLHLSSYLRGGGRNVMAAIGGALGPETGAFAAGLAGSENIRLFMNPPEHRITWEGDADLAVLPLFEGALDESGFVIGYRPGGMEVSVEFYSQATLPVFLVGSTSIDFGSDPERRRISAPGQGRRTISTPEEEFGVLGLPALSSVSSLQQCDEFSGEGCDPCLLNPRLAECAGGPPSPPPTRPGFFVAGTQRCFVPLVYRSHPGDQDRDFVFDDCEYRLAAAMAPALLIDAADRAPTFEPYYAVRRAGRTRAGRRTIKIFYAVGYHGDPGPFGHKGDSEFVWVMASSEGDGYWSPEYTFTAAHVGSPAASSELWAMRPENVYLPTRLTLLPAFVSTRPLAPRVWVSRDKHGNYGSMEQCNNGGGFFGIPIPTTGDTCTGNVDVQDFRAYADGNLGREARHGPPMRNCTRSRLPGFYGQECFWRDRDFTGWQSLRVGESGATPYLNHLRSHGYD